MNISLEQEVDLVFELFDKNKDKFISKEEIQYAMKQYCSIICTELELKQMIFLCDLDKDGKLSYREFYSFYSEITGIIIFLYSGRGQRCAEVLEEKNYKNLEPIVVFETKKIVELQREFSEKIDIEKKQNQINSKVPVDLTPPPIGNVFF